MKKILNYVLSINNLIKQIGFQHFINLTKDDLSFKVLDNFYPNTHLRGVGGGGLKILFLSPHPDDDVFSSGGTLAKFARAGAKIKVVYFNDGAGGTKDGKDDPKLIEIRKKEAIEATKILGITDLEFLNTNNAIASKRSNLLVIIRDFKPNIIFTPSVVDNHPNHKDVAVLLYSVLNHKSKILNLKFDIWQYEVWTPIIPNRLVNIDDVVELKKQAIKCHRSQLACRDYLNAIIDLNSFRAKSMGAGKYAEGFFVSNLQTFKILAGND